MRRYEIIEKIGRGKYSDVYKAVRIGETAKDDKLSVLKILKPSTHRLTQFVKKRYAAKSRFSRR
jgi:serine/threonine protein kinase